MGPLILKRTDGRGRPVAGLSERSCAKQHKSVHTSLLRTYEFPCKRTYAVLNVHTVKKPIQIKVDEEDLSKWKLLAAEAQVNLSEWIRLKCAGAVDTSVIIPQYTDFRGTEALAEIPGSNPGREAEHVASGSTEAGGLKPPSAKPKSAKQSLAEAVAERTRHPVGHQCFECMQAERFFRAMRKEAE